MGRNKGQLPANTWQETKALSSNTYKELTSANSHVSLEKNASPSEPQMRLQPWLTLAL